MIKILKKCTKCKKLLPLSEYYCHKGHKHDKQSRCKKCCSAINKDRYNNILKHDHKYKKERAKYSHDWHIRNKDKNNKRVAADHRQRRLVCLERYGGKCACCGEDRYEFLAIDHINGGGGKHRKNVGAKIDRWLIKNNFPDGFRVLCHNCNQSLGHYGFCPHNKEKESRGILTFGSGG